MPTVVLKLFAGRGTGLM